MENPGRFCVEIYVLVFIQNLLVRLAEKVLLMQPLTFRGDYRSFNRALVTCSWLARETNLDQFTLTDDSAQLLGDDHADNPISAHPLNISHAALSTLLKQILQRRL